MNFLRNLFSDSGNISMMRMLSLISLLIGGYLALSGKDSSVSIFVISAFTGKVIQKAVESK